MGKTSWHFKSEVNKKDKIIGKIKDASMFGKEAYNDENDKKNHKRNESQR